MTIFRINQNYKNFARLLKILSVLAKYGFSAFLKRISDGLGTIPKGVVTMKAERSILGLTEPVRLRMAIEELGPAFIKLGQIMSLRPDIIPPAFAKELETLQDKTTPVGFGEIKAAIEEQLGTPIEDVFLRFEEVPVASGSIAQVYRAVLKKEQKDVAIKILKPGTGKIIETDLNVIRLLVRLATGRIPEFQAYNLTGVFREFSEFLLAQLNLLREARIMQRFSSFFRDVEYVHIPEVYMDYSTEHLLVMEFIDGVKISDLDALDRAGMDRETIAKNGAALALREIFDFGFYHADPHPGNLFVLPGNIIVPVDFGITGYIDEEGILIIGNILSGLIERDTERIIRYLKRYDFIDEEADEKKLKIDLYDIIDAARNTPIGQISMGTAIRSLFSITRKHRIRFPGEYFLIFNTLLESDGVGRMVCPEFNITEFARPWVRRWAGRQYSPKRYMKELFYLAEDLGYFLKLLPSEVNILLKRFRTGRLRLPISIENLDKTASEIDRTGNRLSFAIIIASLLLSSTILVQAKIGPLISGYPVLGLVGLFAALVMGLWLLIGILRSGRL
jgi:ubiquinone biosynthesis protein